MRKYFFRGKRKDNGEWVIGEDDVPDYCPNCGAKMDGGKHET